MTADVLFFTAAAGFREWLSRHHGSASEVWVGFYRKDSGEGGISYHEALDEALCFGWIDGIRKKVDSRSYTNRFTPRTSRSTWSNVNIKRAQELIAAARMHPSGLAAFEARSAANSGVYSFEQASVALTPAFEDQFRARAAAWDYFQRQPPHYRRTATYWVMSARREETRARRLATLIADSEGATWIALLRRAPSGG